MSRIRFLCSWSCQTDSLINAPALPPRARGAHLRIDTLCFGKENEPQSLPCLLGQIDQQHAATDFLATDCDHQHPGGWVHFGKRAPRDYLDGAQIYSCQIPVVRQSARLLRRVLAYYR